MFKNRLNDNMHGSIILAKGGHRKLAQAYGRMTKAELASALSHGDLQEFFP